MFETWPDISRPDRAYRVSQMLATSGVAPQTTGEHGKSGFSVPDEGLRTAQEGPLAPSGAESVGQTGIMNDDRPGGEPFAYMSSSNYRGLRSPWSILLLATMMLVTGMFIVVAPLVTAGARLWVAGYPKALG